MINTALAFDYGLKKIGLAIGNLISKTASPLAIICNNNTTFIEIEKFVKKWQPDIFVIGMPFNMDFTMSAMGVQVQYFAKKLKNNFDINYELIDERLSSFNARKMKDQWDLHRRDYNKLDDLAAMLLLEDWLRKQKKNYNKCS